ncbi:MAG: LysM peptidoglycan-binding domain-containing protein [Desulfamplus sp.]|nr:LysM peptidoglycan-binding domain-containing protein [Desulfamplus sp.]
MDKHKASEADLLKDNVVIGRNRKKMMEDSEFSGASLLKRNEMSLVLLGAGILTIILFFFFLRPSEDDGIGAWEGQETAQSVKALEDRLTRVEEALKTFDVTRMLAVEDGQGVSASEIAPLKARVERVETALSVKFDILADRVDKMEGTITAISKDFAQKRQDSGKKTLPPSSGSVTEKTAQKIEARDTAKVQDVKVQKQELKDKTKQPLYHLIEKGDTLYSISRKYNTTVPHLRKINQMSTSDAIIIGEKIIVKE